MYIRHQVQMSITEPPFAFYYEKYRYMVIEQLEEEAAKWRPKYQQIQKHCLHLLSEDEYFNRDNPYVKQLYSLRDRMIVLDYLIKDFRS